MLEWERAFISTAHYFTASQSQMSRVFKSQLQTIRVSPVAA